MFVEEVYWERVGTSTMGFSLTLYNLADDAIENVPGSISAICCPLTRDQEQQDRQYKLILFVILLGDEHVPESFTLILAQELRRHASVIQLRGTVQIPPSRQDYSRRDAFGRSPYRPIVFRTENAKPASPSQGHAGMPAMFTILPLALDPIQYSTVRTVFLEE